MGFRVILLSSRQELLDLIFHIFYIDYRSSRHPYVETINRLRHTVLSRTRKHPSPNVHTHFWKSWRGTYFPWVFLSVNPENHTKIFIPWLFTAPVTSGSLPYFARKTSDCGRGMYMRLACLRVDYSIILHSVVTYSFSKGQIMVITCLSCLHK